MNKIIKSIPLFFLVSNVVYASPNDGLDEYTIDDIVVSATGYEQEINKAPASISIVTKEEIQEKGVTDLRNILSDVEGVDVRGASSRMGVANVSIRGMGARYTLILIDGIPIKSPSDAAIGPNGFNAELSGFIPPASNIEKIEVIKGPMSTLYGSDAIGGVINIITKKITDKDHGSLKIDHTFETEEGRGDTTRISLTTSGPIIKNKLGYQLRGNFVRRLNSTDKDGKTYDGANITPSGAKNFSIGSKFAWSPNKDNTYIVDLDYGRVDYTDCGEKNPGFRFDKQAFIFKSENKTNAGFWESYITYNKTNLRDWGTLSGGTPYETMEAQNLIVDTKYTTELGSHKLIAGGRIWRESVDLDTLRSRGMKGNLSAINKSIFIDDTWKFSDKFSFTYGARYDMPDNYSPHISPRGYLVYSPSSKWVIKGGISTGYKSPTLLHSQDGLVEIQDSSWGRGGGHTTYIYGNPNLKAETSVSKEIGFYFTPQKKVSTHITFFDIKYKDKISAIEIDSTHKKYDNMDKGQSHGIEFGLKAPVGKEVDLTFNYTFTLSSVDGGKYDGMPLYNTPRHAVNARLNWQADKKTNVFFGMEFKNRMPRYTQNSRVNQNVINQLGKFYKPYSVFYLGLNHKINKRTTLNFTIYNLFDKRFDKYITIDGTEYNMYCSSGKGGTGSYLGGRSFLLGLTYEW